MSVVADGLRPLVVLDPPAFFEPWHVFVNEPQSDARRVRDLPPPREVGSESGDRLGVGGASVILKILTATGAAVGAFRWYQS